MTPDGRSLEETLRDERRLCKQCSYEILNPLTDRCPRCFSTVERIETNCGSCTHQGNCEFVRAGLANKIEQT